MLLANVLRRLIGTRLRIEVLPIGDTCTICSNGLRSMGLPEVAISECPSKLKDVVSNLVLQIAQNGWETPASLMEGKTIEGRFVRANQSIVEVFRLVRAKQDDTALRVVDLENESIFPYRLIATHLCATAEFAGQEALRLLLVAIEVWPKQVLASDLPLADYELNPNNFWSWIDSGTALLDNGRLDDAILQWKTAACMWPRGAKLYASRMLRGSSTDPLQSPKQRARSFWRTVNNESIVAWCNELSVDLPDSALMD